MSPWAQEMACHPQLLLEWSRTLDVHGLCWEDWCWRRVQEQRLAA